MPFSCGTGAEPAEILVFLVLGDNALLDELVQERLHLVLLDLGLGLLEGLLEGIGVEGLARDGLVVIGDLLQEVGGGGRAVAARGRAVVRKNSRRAEDAADEEQAGDDDEEYFGSTFQGFLFSFLRMLVLAYQPIVKNR